MVLMILGIILFIASLIAIPFMKGKFKAISPIVGAICMVMLIILSCISYVPTGYTGIVTTFGKVNDITLDAGIAIHRPWDRVITMDNREQKVPFTLQSFSRDIQQVDITGSINLNINKTTAMNLYREVGTRYIDVLVQPRIQEDVKIVIARYTAEQLIENRQAASDAIQDLIRDELSGKGINVISLAVENIDFTDTFETAVEAKQVATQEKQRAQTEQEQKTMEAKQAATRKRIEAEAAAEVQKIQAEAEAYAVRQRAAAEAEANKEISESLTPDLIQYTQINQWNGELPKFMSGNTIPMLNFGSVEE